MNAKIKWLLLTSVFLVSVALSTTLTVVLTKPNNKELIKKDDENKELQEIKDANKKKMIKLMNYKNS